MQRGHTRCYSYSYSYSYWHAWNKKATGMRATKAIPACVQGGATDMCATKEIPACVQPRRYRHATEELPACVQPRRYRHACNRGDTVMRASEEIPACVQPRSCWHACKIGVQLHCKPPPPTETKCQASGGGAHGYHKLAAGTGCPSFARCQQIPLAQPSPTPTPHAPRPTRSSDMPFSFEDFSDLYFSDFQNQ